MIDTVLNIYYFTKLRDWVEFGHWVGPFIRLNLYINIYIYIYIICKRFSLFIQKLLSLVFYKLLQITRLIF